MKNLFTLLLAIIVGQSVFANTMSMGNWRWRNDNGSQSSATYSANENVPITLTNTATPIRLRMSIYSNIYSYSGTGGRIKLQYTSTALTTPNGYPINNDGGSDQFAGSVAWTDVSTNGTGAFSMYNSSNIANQAATTEQLSDIGGTVYQDNGLYLNSNTTNASDAYAAGKVFTTSNGNTSDQTISSSQKTELEFAIKPNAGVTPSTVYYFRVVGYLTTLPNYLYAIGGHLSSQTTAPNGGANNNGTGLNGGTGVTNIKAGNGYPYLTTSAAVLPITLTDFNVVVNANGNEQVNWATSSENNSANYVIESGIDGVHFSPLATVASKNLATGAAYAYTYISALPQGVNYFRLKAVDKDGSFIYSAVKTVNVVGANKIAIAPNPISNTLNITGVQSGSTIQLYNLNAQKILTRVATGASLQSISVGNLAHGAYYVKVINAGKVIANQLVIKQ